MISLLNPYRYGGGIVAPAGSYSFWPAEANADDIVSTNHGTLGGTTAFGTGYDGHQAFVFDGNNTSKVAIPSINLGSSFSICFYVYRNGSVSTSRHLISNAYTSASNFGALYLTNESGTIKLSYWQNSTEKARIAFPIADTTWYKVLLSYDGTKMSYWIDDVLRHIETHSESFNNAVAFGQAVSNESAAMLGKIDDVAFYNSVKYGTQGLVCQLDAENNTNDTLSHWNFTAGGSTAYATGRTGNAFSFTGSHAQAPRISHMCLGDNYSIDFWINPSGASSGFNHLMSNAYNAAGGLFGALYYTTGNALRYYSGGVSRILTAGSVITASTWNRVTLTYTKADSFIRLYVNGSLVGTSSSTTEVFNNGVSIGGQVSSESSAFSGLIDDIKFYNTLILP